jgi:two-component system sensor histidine kinase LytS
VGSILQLLIELLKNMALIALTAYLLIHTRPLRLALEGEANLKDKALLAVIFGLLSIAGNYLGIPVMGALANNRMIAPVVGGLLAGPMVGISAGLIGGLHRLFLGGFTAWACAVGNVFAGLVGSCFYLVKGPRNISGKTALLSGLLSEAILKALVLLLAKPFSAALTLERTIAVPTIMVNSIGVTIFVMMVQNVRKEHLRVGASYAEKALQIASQTMPVIRKGLNAGTATRVVEIILSETKAAAVAITDKEKVLAFAGQGSDHHRTGQPVAAQVVLDVLNSGSRQVAHQKELLGCYDPQCPLSSAIVVPLWSRDEIVGTFSIINSNGDKITDVDLKLAEGIGNLLSLQLEIAQLNEQSKLLARAEFSALKAQLNPHFLFNSLSVIMSCCRSKPEEARELLLHLSRLLRRRLRENDDLVPLHDELEAVDDFLFINKVRFGSKLQVRIEIGDHTEDCLVPVFSIQPLVENALRHGFIEKEIDCRIEVKTSLESEFLKIEVIDNGAGIQAGTLERIRKGQRTEHGGVGLNNIMQRLKLLYGDRAGCTFETAPGKGTRVILHLPQVNGSGDDEIQGISGR